jgi:hypothetical protein
MAKGKAGVRDCWLGVLQGEQEREHAGQGRLHVRADGAAATVQRTSERAQSHGRGQRMVEPIWWLSWLDVG